MNDETDAGIAQQSGSTIRAVIFDLDHCLCDPKEAEPELFDPVFDAIRRANRGTLSDDELEAAFADCFRIAYDAAAERHGFSREMVDAGWRAFATIEIEQPFHGFSDLHLLERFEATLFLVTTGFRRLQESKIRTLGIAPHFAEIHVDAIDELDRTGKQSMFDDIRRRHAFVPSEVLVVGDNPDSEIEAGNRLGMPTIQILRPGVVRSAKAMSHVRDLGELHERMARFGGRPSE